MKHFQKTKGQLMLEAVWLILFSFAFLAMLSHLYEKGNREIQMGRMEPNRNIQSYKNKLE